MGWDKRGYYYHARKVNGRVIREYAGSGKLAMLAAQLATVEREKKELERAQAKFEWTS